MIFDRGPFDDGEPKRLAVKIDPRLKLRNPDGDVMQAFNHNALSIGANDETSACSPSSINP